MKLRNLMYATMIACAFSACSNDDDPTPGPDAAQMDATLTVGYAVDGAIKTRAIADGDDAGIKNIALAVFNNGAMSNMTDGALLSYQIIDNTKADTTACVSAKSGNVKIMVAANLAEADLAGVKDLAGFQAAISKAKLSSQINGNLLMSSQVVSVNLAPGRNVICTDAQKTSINWDTPLPTGAGLKLQEFKVYRNVAKIKIGSIKVAPRADFGERGNYAKFTLEKAFVDHVRYTTKIFGANDAASKWNSVQDIVTNDEGQHMMLSGATYPSLTSDFKENNIFAFGEATGSANPNLKDGQFYVFDNASTTAITTATSTRLILKGKYEYKADNGEILTSENAYWIAEVNNNDVAASNGNFTPHFGVMRNVEYTMDITITGPGMGDIPNPPIDPTDPENPDPVDPTPENPDGQAACIQIAVTVVPWGHVTDNPSLD